MSSKDPKGLEPEDGAQGASARPRTLRLRYPIPQGINRSPDWGFRVFRVVLIASMVGLAFWSIHLFTGPAPVRGEIEAEENRIEEIADFEEELFELGLAAPVVPVTTFDRVSFDRWLVRRGDDLRRLGVAPEEHLDEAAEVRAEIQGLLAALSNERRARYRHLHTLQQKGGETWTGITFLIVVLFLQALAALVLLDLNVRARRRIDVLFKRATRDELTGVLNRRAIVECADRELERAAREGTDLALMLVDLDWFKQVNDRLGHRAGDELLREASVRFESSLRPYDSVGRYGGDEFLVVLPGCDVEAAEVVADRICRALREPADVGGQRWAGSVSIGAAIAIRGGAVLSELMESADAALYRTKGRGRDGWTVTSHLPNVGVPAPSDVLDLPEPVSSSD